MHDPGTIGVEASARRRAAGIDVTLRLRIPENAHIEAHEPPEPTLIATVAHFEGLEVEEVSYPEPVEKDLGLPGPPLRVYEGDVTIRARGRADASLGSVRGTIRYQPCVGGACLPPRTQPWRALVEESPDSRPAPLAGQASSP